jgi:hypothetical protein
LPSFGPDIDITAHLRSDMNRLKGEFYELERGFFSRIGYLIGGMAFTPDQFEHGIPRGNRRPFKPFSIGTPRLALGIEPPDPRIHFTLVCASSSRPPINL